MPQNQLKYNQDCSPLLHYRKATVPFYLPHLILML